MNFNLKGQSSLDDKRILTVSLISLAFILMSCIGLIREYHLCRNIVFTGSENHTTNNLSYGVEICKGVILFGNGVDLVVSSDKLAIIRQMNVKSSYAYSEFRPQFNRLKELRVSYLYWIIMLDKVPAQLGEGEHGERVHEFTLGPFLESEAIDTLENSAFDTRKLVVTFICKGRFVPRWMNAENAADYYNPQL